MIICNFLVATAQIFAYFASILIQYSSTVYRDHAGLGFLAPQNQLNIYFVTTRQD